MTVVFSTYQSIQVIANAQRELLKQKKDWENLISSSVMKPIVPPVSH